MNRKADAAPQLLCPDIRVLFTALAAAACAAYVHHELTATDVSAKPAKSERRFEGRATDAMPLFVVRASDRAAPAGGGDALVAAGAQGERPAAPESEAPQPRIKVHPGVPETASAAALRAAYAALRAGDRETAQRLYTNLERSEPRNVDVLLGLAALAMHAGDSEDAAQFYLRILRLDPKHTLAQAALLAAFGRADAHAAEARLKELASRDPSAPLYQMLGNLYAEQSLWPQAQQAYFRAYQLAPDHCDHAYNLAVGLDHIGEHKLALNFYRRAVALSRGACGANFGLEAVAERIARLSRPGD